VLDVFLEAGPYYFAQCPDATKRDTAGHEGYFASKPMLYHHVMKICTFGTVVYESVIHFVDAVG
jgi:hypothetical protein